LTIVQAAAAALLVMSATQAFAAAPARQTVDWYRAHQEARENVLQACRNDHSLDSAADCWNATSASHGALADSLATTEAGTKDPEADTAYYRHDAKMLAVTLSLCEHLAAPASWCQAAQTAAAERQH
jgi:hypothetical protein